MTVSVKVHNITDRNGTKPQAVTVGGVCIRPGKHETIPVAQLKARHYAMSDYLYIGDNPPKKSTVVTDSAPLDVLSWLEVSKYLDTLSATELLQLADSASPKIVLQGPQTIMALRLAKAIFSDKHILDPEAFFWLGRWRKVRGGYEPVE